jgi:hypothetical protein
MWRFDSFARSRSSAAALLLRLYSVYLPNMALFADQCERVYRNAKASEPHPQASCLTHFTDPPSTEGCRRFSIHLREAVPHYIRFGMPGWNRPRTGSAVQGWVRGLSGVGWRNW